MARISREKQAAYQRRHYLTKKLYYKQKAAERRTILYTRVAQYKAERGCSLCAEKDPACLDLHHPGDDKEISISGAIRVGMSWTRISAEIEKCVVVCANCHRKLHATDDTRRSSSVGEHGSHKPA